MEASIIEKVIHAVPFNPYRLVLQSREKVTVRKPRKSHVSGDQVALVGMVKSPGKSAVERFRLIRVDQVVRIETVESITEQQRLA